MKNEIHRFSMPILLTARAKESKAKIAADFAQEFELMQRAQQWLPIQSAVAGESVNGVNTGSDSDRGLLLVVSGRVRR
jgi:hypothetical protein